MYEAAVEKRPSAAFPFLRQAQDRLSACHGELVEPSGALHPAIFEQPASRHGIMDT
jgi:hypothetical protein